MSTFVEFANILPDPINKIRPSGDSNILGAPGPGFLSVSFKSRKEGRFSRARSGSGIGISSGNHSWIIDISYNQMLEEEFLVLQGFLDARNPATDPFYVMLPQNLKPKDSAFETFCNSNLIRNVSQVNAGSSSMMIYAGTPITGNPSVGDIFNVEDPTNVNHIKTYRITRVETNTAYQIGQPQPTTSQKRIHFSPNLNKTIAANSTIKFIQPKIRVVTVSDIMEPVIDDNGLYSFSLQLEEALI